MEVQLDGRPLSMELDTGAAASLISVKTDHALFPNTPLLESAATLSTYTRELLTVVGQREVDVCFDGQKEKLFSTDLPPSSTDHSQFTETKTTYL